MNIQILVLLLMLTQFSIGIYFWGMMISGDSNVLGYRVKLYYSAGKIREKVLLLRSRLLS